MCASSFSSFFSSLFLCGCALTLKDFEYNTVESVELKEEEKEKEKRSMFKCLPV